MSPRCRNANAKKIGEARVKLGSRGRIRRCFHLLSGDLNRFPVGNQANSVIAGADSFTAICWQFCWQLNRGREVRAQ